MIEEFSKRKSQSILSLVDNITAEFIQHLDEAIKFSMSEIEKINSIKQHFENYLKEQGKINLLNQEGHLKLCEEDIKKYRVDEMIQLMENLRKAKLTINHILGEKKD